MIRSRVVGLCVVTIGAVGDAESRLSILNVGVSPAARLAALTASAPLATEGTSLALVPGSHVVALSARVVTIAAIIPLFPWISCPLSLSEVGPEP